MVSSIPNTFQRDLSNPYMTLTGTITPGESEPGSNYNDCYTIT